jgi:hypothetical protein
MSIIAWIILGLGAGLLTYHLATSRGRSPQRVTFAPVKPVTAPAGLVQPEGETSVLVRAEKRLYPGQDRQLLARDGVVHQDKRPL